METQNTIKQNTLQGFISDGTPEAVRARYEALSAWAQAADFGELDHNIVVLDTETTGFSYHHDELTQIAAARLEKGEITEWFITFVNPGKKIPDEVARLTNIHDEDVAGAPSPSDALASLVSFVGDAWVVAHNIEFDRTFTTRHPSGYPLLENIWIDSLDLARIVLPRLKSHRLLDLVRAFNAPLSTHRADVDVVATCVIYRILLAGVAAMPLTLVKEIADMASTEQWSTGIVFKKMSDLQADEGFLAQFQQAPNDIVQKTPPCLSSAESVPTTNTSVSRETISKAGRFSLRAARQNRLKILEYEEKIDADNIASDPQQCLVFPSADEIKDAFSRQGLVGALYEDFEPRPEQATMAEAVRSVFASSQNLAVEAGTGVGKSMAYLVPAALTAKKNNISIGVATKTNALLDQLVYHELPALAKALACVLPHQRPLRYASLKGFTHYPCLRKIEKFIDEGVRIKLVAGEERSQAPALAALLSFIEQTSYDDIDGLKIDYRVLPRYMITTTSRDCLRRKCPYYKTMCFVHGARQLAETADIVVTNHSLLFCDLVADNGLLPPIRYWVIDEAHGAEAEARSAFSISVAAEDIVRLAHRVELDEGIKNVFTRAERRVESAYNDEGGVLFQVLLQKARTAGKKYAGDALEFSAHIKDLLFFDKNTHNKNYDTVDLWINEDIRNSETFNAIVSFGCAMAQSAEALMTACQEIVGYLEDAEGAAEIQREIASVAMELKDQIKALKLILDKAPEPYAYAASINRKKDKTTDKLEALPVDVGEEMNNTLFARTHSVIFTSATLVVDKSFDSFERALGLNTSEYSVCQTRRLDSSYDFDNHMTIYVVNDMSEPNEASYLPKLQELLVMLHRAQKGSMLTLFTNRHEMEKCFDVVQPQLKSDDLRVVCQKWGVSVKGLRDDFLADEHLSLFALKSFWEGFDAPGSTLKGVIIPKLPFTKPTDPLSCERAARDDQAWRHYVLPAAVLETKQAAGRLIRNAQDTGVLVLADKRLLTKNYGKIFLNSLPSRTIKIMTSLEIAQDLLRNHARERKIYEIYG